MLLDSTLIHVPAKASVSFPTGFRSATGFLPAGFLREVQKVRPTDLNVEVKTWTFQSVTVASRHRTWRTISHRSCVTMTYSSLLALLVFGTFIWSAAGSCTCCQNKPLSSCIVAGEARDQSSCEFFDSTCEWDSTCGATDSTCTPNFECECFFCDFEMAFMFFGVLLTACTCCCFKSLNSRAERMDQRLNLVRTLPRQTPLYAHYEGSDYSQKSCSCTCQKAPR